MMMERKFCRFVIARGIQLKKICGQYYLIADRTMQDICPVIVPMTDAGALIIQILEENRGAENDVSSLSSGETLLNLIVENICSRYEVEYQQARIDVLRFCQDLESRGYLICPEEKNE